MRDKSRTLAHIILVLIALVAAAPREALAVEELKGFDAQVFEWAKACRDEILEQMTAIARSGKIPKAMLFDTFYIPIPNTDPQKYTTKYDRLWDEYMREILDRYLSKDKKIAFVVAVDVNGYLPTHNTRYSQPLTGNPDADVKNNRTKRMFNDRTARNEEVFLLQKYSRDTGEMMADLSVPIIFEGRRWGALRFGYRQ
jgi:methyl-accepting chemotaxis protein